MRTGTAAFGSRSAAIVAAAALALSACAAAPRERPVKMGPATGSLADVRKQFEGTWDLVAFEAAGADGRLAPVRASGTLTYDDFGNLEIVGRILDQGGAVAAMTLDIKGRAVFDAPNQRLWITPERGTGAELVIPDGAAFDRFRYYELGGDELRLTVKDQSGAVTARTVWRRQGPMADSRQPASLRLASGSGPSAGHHRDGGGQSAMAAPPARHRAGSSSS